jgi:hypothetical protein
MQGRDLQRGRPSPEVHSTAGWLLPNTRIGRERSGSERTLSNINRLLKTVARSSRPSRWPPVPDIRRAMFQTKKKKKKGQQ